MKKNITNFIFISLILLIAFEVLKESETVTKAIKLSFSIWQNNIFPSLFPFFIIGNILIYYGFPQIIGEFTKNITNFLFKINPNASCIIVLSILSGFPSSAKYTKELLDNGMINEKDATKILMFTHFSNPLFIISLSNSILHDKYIAIPILISHYLGNLFIGLLFRNYNKSNIMNSRISFNNINLKKIKFSDILTKAIKDSISTLLLILGTISVFLVFTSLISQIFNINNTLKPIINGIFEMTQGIKFLEFINIDINIKALIIVGIISFGGLSVHMQVLTIISDTKIKYFPYFISRILHIVISIIIFFFWKIF